MTTTATTTTQKCDHLSSADASAKLKGQENATFIYHATAIYMTSNATYTQHMQSDWSADIKEVN